MIGTDRLDEKCGLLENGAQKKKKTKIDKALEKEQLHLELTTETCLDSCNDPWEPFTLID